MANLIPPDHVDDLHVVEPNQPDDVPATPELVLVDEDEDPEEEEFEEEEEPQEEEDDMEVDIKEDENEPELTFSYEEADPLNLSPLASDSEPEDVIEVKDTVEHEDETVPASVHEVGESSTASFHREDSDGLLPGLMRRDIDNHLFRDINSLFGRIASLLRRVCGRETAHAFFEKKGKEKDKYHGKLIVDLGNEVRSSVEEGTDAMENLVRKLGNDKEGAECKKLKKELEEARFSNTLLCMQNELVERDLCWTRVEAHEFYREMIRRGVVFEERPNEAIDVPVEDEESPSSEPRGSLCESYVDAAIAAERARHANAGNNASGSGQARGQVTTPVVQECTFAGFMKCNPDNFRGTEGVVELRRWFEKTEMNFGISECAEDKKVKFAAATLQGRALTWWNSKVAILGLDIANQMGWTEMKKLMTTEFCPAKELQRMENEL
ncbi:hypothetical protein Tco_0565418 [Tanacetum coccineum]